MSDDRFSHLDEQGRARMVDVSGKEITRRTARAACRVLLGDRVFAALVADEVPKGDVFATAKIAGIQAAKKTDGLVPLCHSLPLDHVDIVFRPETEDHAVTVQSEVICTARTGAEMEALTACAVAALSIYDMCKALSKSIRITDLRLLSKSGGRSGEYEAD